MASSPLFWPTGNLLRAARVLSGLSQEEAARRAVVSRPCLAGWEGSSCSMPNVRLRDLRRIVEVYESEGVHTRPRWSYLLMRLKDGLACSGTRSETRR